MFESYMNWVSNSQSYLGLNNIPLISTVTYLTFILSPVILIGTISIFVFSLIIKAYKKLFKIRKIITPSFLGKFRVYAYAILVTVFLSNLFDQVEKGYIIYKMRTIVIDENKLWFAIITTSRLMDMVFIVELAIIALKYTSESDTDK